MSKKIRGVKIYPNFEQVLFKIMLMFWFLITLNLFTVDVSSTIEA